MDVLPTFDVRPPTRSLGVLPASAWLHAVCTKFQDETVRNLPCKRLQCDEIWSFVGGKDKNLSDEKKEQGQGNSIPAMSSVPV